MHFHVATVVENTIKKQTKKMLFFRVKQLTTRTSRYQKEINQSQFSVKFTSYCQLNIKCSVYPSAFDITSRRTCVYTKIVSKNSVNS